MYMDAIGSPLPFVAINALAFVVAWVIVRTSRFYREQDGQPAPGRAQMIDGLRGWLALGVFFTHVALMYAYNAGGAWDAPASAFYRLTGEIAVSLFFMITGFLFWTRALRGGDRFDTAALYRSRLRRIVPMYLVSVAIMLIVVAVISGFRLNTGPAELARQLRAWLSFGFMRGDEINGVRDAHNINAVYWTLAYEWSFYVALPLLAVIARRIGHAALFAVAFVYALAMPVTLNFIVGALVAILVERRLLGPWLRDWKLAPLPVAALIAVLFFPSAYALVPVLLMSVFFVFVVGGNSLFGLLASAPARVLGTISYSLYLVHCIVVYTVVRAVNARVPIATLQLHEYLLVALLAAVLAIVLSAVTYRYVEYPFLKRRLRSAEPAGAAQAAIAIRVASGERSGTAGAEQPEAAQASSAGI